MSETNTLAKKPGFTPGKGHAASASSASVASGADKVMSTSAAPHQLNTGSDEHTTEVHSIQGELRSISAWISHRLGFHPAHEAAKQSIEAAAGHLQQSLNPSAQAVASGVVTVQGTSPPYNQTSPGATYTSTPGKGPSTDVA